MEDRLHAFKRRPYPATTAPDLYFPADTHEAALSLLETAFESGDGIALLDGTPGTGKTLLLLKMLENLGDRIVPIFVPSTRFQKPIELYQTILFDLGLTYLGLSEGEVRLTVTEKLLTTAANRKRVALVLDESHHLQPELLEEIRLLDNLEASGTKAVFSILSGLPAIRTILESIPLAGLSQRIRCRSRIEPMTQEESERYLRHQLEHCDPPRPALFTSEAISLIAAHARGIPRQLNQAAWTAYEFAQEGEQDAVDAEAAYEALSRLGILIEESEGSVFPRPARPAYPAGAARSTSGEPRETSEVGEPGKDRSPKQTARKRRPA